MLSTTWSRGKLSQLPGCLMVVNYNSQTGNTENPQQTMQDMQSLLKVCLRGEGKLITAHPSNPISSPITPRACAGRPPDNGSSPKRKVCGKVTNNLPTLHVA